VPILRLYSQLRLIINYFQTELILLEETPNEKKYCSFCGKEINFEAKFCPICGKEQRNPSDVETEEKPKVSPVSKPALSGNDISGGLKAFGILNIIFGSITTLSGLTNIGKIGMLQASEFYKIWIVITFLSSAMLLAGGIGILSRKKVGKMLGQIACFWLLAEHAVHVGMGFLIMADKSFFMKFVPRSFFKSPLFRGEFKLPVEMLRIFAGVVLIIFAVGLGCYYYFQLRMLKKQSDKYK
jgi:hypothetical protein